MTPASCRFRTTHLLTILDGYDHQTAPIDFYLSNYFREHKALGSKDRAYISEEVYRLIRWKGLLDYLLQKEGKSLTWFERLNCLTAQDPRSYLQDKSIPEHVRLSLPEALYAALLHSWDKEIATLIGTNLLESAPTFIRVNLLKTSPEALLQRLKSQGYDVSRGSDCETAIIFHKKVNFFILDEFREGLFEVQDEASQMVADLVRCKPHDQVLDFCAGAGGKSLAFAPKLQGSGQIFLHDVRLHALQDAKKRLKRAGIQNAQIVHADDAKRLKKLKKNMDWVLVDAPCTGTGTLRRNPDMKWKYTTELLKRLVSEQRVIFERALSYVKPGGHIVYATCSVLAQENGEQLEHFLKTYPLKREGEPYQSRPESGKKDGFFACVFQLKSFV